MMTSCKQVRIAAINCRGVKGRVDKINEFVRREKEIGIIVLSETWLRVGEEAPRFAEFEVVIDERGVIGEGASRASGGLLIIARVGMKITRGSSNREMAIVSVGDINIIGCYFKPYNSENNEVGRNKDKQFRDQWEILEGEVALKPETIIVGDFNAHGLQGDPLNYPRGKFVKNKLGNVLDRVEPKIGKWTTFTLQGGKGINDHVFVAKGNPLQVEVIVHENESLGGSDHRLLTITANLIKPLDNTEPRLRWDFKNIGRLKGEIQEELLARNPYQAIEDMYKTVRGWVEDREIVSRENRTKLLDEGWNTIKNWIEETVLKFTQRKQVRPNYRKDFLTPEMLKHREKWKLAETTAQQATLQGAEKDELKRLWREVGDHAQWWTKRIKRRRINVFTKVVDSMYKTPGTFQKMVSCLKKRESRLGGKCRLDTDKMSVHASYFVSTFGANPTGNEDEIDTPLLHRTDPCGSYTCAAPAPNAKTSIASLSKIIRDMPNNKAAGSDEIPGEIWKLLAPLEICIETIAKFFNICDAISTTPTEWKVARVIPVFKNKGDPSMIANYRPIALTQVIRRIFEKQFIQRKLADIPEKLAHTQGGFRTNRSTLDQVTILHEILCRIPTSVVTFLDIKAAYDTVDRRLLWTRMAHDFLVPEQTIGLLRDLFDLNIVILVIKGEDSEDISLKRGLLQGSSISPLLFNIFINELLIELQKLPKIHMGGSLWNHLFFADDGALIATNNKDANILSSKAHTWGQDNGISFAIEKCKYIATLGSPWTIKMNDVPLERVNDYKYLGIYITPMGINFDKSLQARADTCLQMVNWIGNKGMNTSGWRLQQSITVYKSFLRPMMEYGLCLKILNKKQTAIIQKVQNVALRRMLNGNKSTSIGAMHIVTEIEPMALRNIEIHARFFDSILNGTKKDLPAGQFIQNLYLSKGPRQSLIQDFKSSSPWVADVYHNRLPSVPKLKRLRTQDLCKYQAGLRDATSEKLLPPQGPRKNNLMKWAYLIPRPLLKEIYCFKLGKIPRQECIQCKGTFTAEHLFSCGELQKTLTELTIVYNLKILQGKGAAMLHDLFRRLDGMSKPRMEIYCSIGEALIKAKVLTLSTQFGDKDDDFSDDDRPEDPYNVLIQQALGDQPIAQRTKPILKANTAKRNTEETGNIQEPEEEIKKEPVITEPEEEIKKEPVIEEPEATIKEEPGIARTTVPTEDPIESLRLYYAVFWRDFTKQERNTREAIIVSFIKEDPAHRLQLFTNFYSQGRAKTVWTTQGGVRAASEWIAAFLNWISPRWLEEENDPILYVRDLKC
jgi:hypothetical protein